MRVDISQITKNERRRRRRRDFTIVQLHRFASYLIAISQTSQNMFPISSHEAEYENPISYYFAIRYNIHILLKLTHLSFCQKMG